MGGIVAAKFLSSYYDQYEYEFSLVILGFIAEEITLEFANSIKNTTIIQGSEDKFASPHRINEYIAKIGSHNVNVHTIVGANHSYKNPTTNEPEFEDEAINIAFP